MIISPDHIAPYRFEKDIFYDPLYGYIPINPLLHKALDLKPMQRLRHLKQLSILYLVFSGANHTRFEHSLGVLHLAGEVFDSLYDIKIMEKKNDWPPFTPIHKFALQFAALFHDVGHGPFSHVFEEFCKRNAERFGDYRHEHLTKNLIENGVGNYNQIPTFLHDTQDKIKEKFGSYNNRDLEILSPKNIAAIATGKIPPADPRYHFLSSIVSSTFDVDRMDYLRRDAMYTGVETGSVDIWYLIHNFTLGKSETIEDAWELKLTHNAADALEAFLIARDLVYRRVYNHRSDCAAREMIIRALQDQIDNEKCAIHEMALLNDYELLSNFKDENKGTPLTRDIARRILSRRLYVPLQLNLRFANLDRSAKNKIQTDKTTKPFQEFIKEEKDLAKKLKFSLDHALIFSIDRLKAMDRSGLEKKILIGKNGVSTSLFDLSPHLRSLYGKLPDPYNEEKTTDLLERYLDEISPLYIFIPLEYIDELSEHMKENFEQEWKDRTKGKIPRVVEIQDVKEYLQEYPIEMIEEIIDFFMDFLEVRKTTTKEEIKKKFDYDMRLWFEKIVYDKVKKSMKRPGES